MLSAENFLKEDQVLKKLFLLMFVIFLTGCQETQISTTTTEEDFLTSTSTTTESLITTDTMTTTESLITTDTITTTESLITTDTMTTQTTLTYEIDSLRDEVIEKMEDYLARLKLMDKFTFESDINYLICFNNIPSSIYSEDYLSTTLKIDNSLGYMYNEFSNSLDVDLNALQYISIQEDKLVLNRRVIGGFSQEVISTDLSSENVRNVIQSTFNYDLYFGYFIPDYAKITKFSDNFYRLQITLDELIYFDPYIAQAFGFYNKFYEDDLVDIYIDIKFNGEDFEYKLSHDRYAIGMQHSTAIYFLDVLIDENYYGNTISEYNYPDRTKSFFIFDDPQDCLYTYQADMRFGVSLLMDSVGYFKIYLEAGFYTLDYNFDQQGQAFTFYDEEMNEIPISSTFKIESSGIYYGKLTHGYNNYFSTTFKFNFLDFSKENYFYLPDTHLIGTLDKNEKVLYLLMPDSDEEKVIKLTLNDFNTGLINIKTYGDFQRLNIEREIYLFIQKGSFVILTLNGLYDGSDYDLNWEFIDINFTSTNTLTAPLLNIDQDNVLIVPGTDKHGVVKFTVSETGNYIFKFHQSSTESSNRLTFKIYDSELNLIIECHGNESLDLENGTYYIKVFLTEEVDAMFSITYYIRE